VTLRHDTRHGHALWIMRRPVPRVDSNVSTQEEAAEAAAAERERAVARREDAAAAAERRAADLRADAAAEAVRIVRPPPRAWHPLSP